MSLGARLEVTSSPEHILEEKRSESVKERSLGEDSVQSSSDSYRYQTYLWNFILSSNAVRAAVGMAQRESGQKLQGDGLRFNVTIGVISLCACILLLHF